MRPISLRLFTSHLAFKLLPAALILNALYILVYSNSATIVGNAESAAGQASLLLIFSAGLTCMASCWTGVQLRRTELIHMTAARPSWQVMGLWLAPSFLGGAAAQVAGVLGLLAFSGALPNTRFSLILLAQCAALLVHLALGYWLGKLLRPALAYPLALLASYLWLAFTWTLPITFVRYLAGPAMVMCCSPVEHIDPAAPVALIVFSVVVGGSFLTLAIWQGGRRLIKVGLAMAALAAGGGAGYTVAGHLGPVATSYLADGELACAAQEPEVCVGKVSLARGDLREQISSDFKKLQGIGLPQVRRAVIYRGENTPALYEGTAYIAYPPTLTVDEAHRMVASIYTSPLDRCTGAFLTEDNLEGFKRYSDSADFLQARLTDYLSEDSFTPDRTQEEEIRELYAALSICSLPEGT
ncbi:hypothetical protein [Rothia nasimurium]|uniref:hypothetical protein n=1 Tax=Rothia nasimurium TaxID=85336 RepID=UPI002DD644B9|nr:hypothetical protein [Rothia nasimurium]